MAKKSSVLRNEKRIKMAAKQYSIRQELKAKALDPKASDEDRYKARQKLQALPRIYKKFMVSRIVFREMAHKGLIPGVTKSSW
jgi:small subunit ribosomal protein S14